MEAVLEGGPDINPEREESDNNHDEEEKRLERRKGAG